jgi:rhodanese-related sulfurtransferase
LAPATIDRGPSPFHDVSPIEAERLLAEGAIVLDVRTPREHEELGHVPGALLLPVELVASAPAVLPEGRPVLVICEHGRRSRQAAALLAEAGLGSVLNVTGGMSRWTGPREFGPAAITGPSSWLLSNALSAPRGARTLDVACGRGRHALVLASAGFPVRAIDRDPVRIEALGRVARRLRLPIDTAVVDLEDGKDATSAGADLGDEEWELVLVFNYLHRPLVPAIVRALKPGGVLIYETFVRHAAARGGPTNPAHLLEPGELPELVSPLAVVRRRQGEFDGRYLASVLARKPSLPPRSRVTSHAADAARVAPTPKTQSKPRARAAAPSRARGKRTPGARKR